MSRSGGHPRRHDVLTLHLHRAADDLGCARVGIKDGQGLLLARDLIAQVLMHEAVPWLTRPQPEALFGEDARDTGDQRVASLSGAPTLAPRARWL